MGGGGRCGLWSVVEPGCREEEGDGFCLMSQFHILLSFMYLTFYFTRNYEYTLIINIKLNEI